MSIEPLLNLIRQKFSPLESQRIVQGLSQDPLVWQFIQNEDKSISYFQSAPAIIESYTPGAIVLWVIQQETGHRIENINNLEDKLPQELRLMAGQSFETVLNTGLPPNDLFTAGLLALALRERRAIKGSWAGISDESFLKGQFQSAEKNYRIWRTPFACLYHFLSDINELISEFLPSKSIWVEKAAIPIFLHTFLCNPNDKMEDQLFNIAQRLPIDLQLESLRWLLKFHNQALTQSLAKNLLQTRGNVEYFARVFSELERFETNDQRIDPLEKQVKYSLPEDLNRLAAFYFYSGDAQKAANTYQKSSEVLDFLHSQTSFQSIISTGEKPSQSKLLQILKSVPSATNARYFYINRLIENQTFAEAEKYLNELNDSPEKSYVKYLLESAKDVKKSISADFGAMLPSNPPTEDFNLPGFFVQSVKINNSISLLEHAKDSDIHDTEWVDEILKSSYNDLNIMTSARDLYENAQHFDRATELTSYLHSIQPEKKEHKQALARLYCSGNRWKDAFGTLQDLIKSESKPDIVDLQRFAESAIKTDHIDMGISICHNIIKQDSHNSKALILLGESYLAKGDMAKAIQHMEQVVEMIPENAEPWLTLARIWQENGQTDRAFEVLTKGSLAVPNHPQLLRALGKAHLEKQAPADALTFLTKAYEIEPNHTEGLLDLAQAKHQLGQNDQALKLLEPFEAQYEQNPKIAKLLGLVLLSMGDQSSAEPKLLIAAEHFPQDIDLVLTTTNLILTQQEFSLDETDKDKLGKLGTILANALEVNQDSYQIRLAIADIKRLVGENDQALEAYRDLAEVPALDHGNEQWHLSYGLGKSATAMGNFDLALAALQDANSKKPGNLMVLHALTEAYYANNFSDKAHNSAQSTLKLAPQNIQNILWYADFMKRSNEIKEAVNALKEALQMNPNHSELQLRLARTLLAMGEIDETRQRIKDLINHSHATAKTLHRAGYLCIELNETDLALMAFEKALKLSDELPPALLMDLAYCYSLNNQPTKALETLNANKTILQNCPELALMKSDLLSNLGQYDQAFEILRDLMTKKTKGLESATNEVQAIAKSPLLYANDFSEKGFLHRYGQLSRSLGDFLEAQSALSKALTIDPEDIGLRNDLVESYLAAINFDGALNAAGEQQLDAIKSKKSSDNRLFCNLLEIHLIQGDQDLVDEFSEIISNNEHKSPRLLALQSLIASEKNESQLAEQFYQDAINLYQQRYGHPSLSLDTLYEQTMTLTTMAEAAMQIDDYEGALERHQKALSLVDNQPYQIWRGILNLVNCAEAQQIAKLLSITGHAPGETALNNETYKKTQEMIEQIETYLQNDQAMCLKAKAVGAFSGRWPLSLNADACLSGPKQAASVIISTDDDNLVQDIVSAYPNDPVVLQAYGIYALRNHRKDAVPVVEKAIQIDLLNPINHAILGFLQKDEPNLAVSALETALGFWPDEPEWHAKAAEIYKDMGDVEMAGQHIKQALMMCPGNSCYWEKSGEIKMELNDLDQAREDLEQSVSLEPQNPVLWMKMANVNRRLGNSPEAIENIHKASELDPSNPSFIGQEVRILLDQGRYEDAENRSKEILSQNPSNEQIRIYLAQSQANQGYFEKALQTLSSDSITGKTSTVLQLETLKIKKDQEGIEASLPQLIKLAEEFPNEPSVLITLTDWLIQTNRLKKAEETAQTILRITPDLPEVQLMLGRLQRKNGQLDQAIKHLSDAINADPFLVEAYIELGKTYQDRKNLEEAINIFQKASKANPADARPYYHAGMAMKECKNYSDAEIMLKQAKKYAPNDANIIRQLGVITALNLIHNLRETR